MSRCKTEKVIGFKVDLLGSDTTNVKLVLLCQGNKERSFEVDPLFALGVRQGTGEAGLLMVVVLVLLALIVGGILLSNR